MTFKRGPLGFSALLLATAFGVVPGCASDDDDAAAGGTCTSTGGPVEGPADTHCTDDDDEPIVQPIGMCSTGGEGTAGADGGGGATGSAGAGGGGGHDEHEHDDDEETYEIRYGNKAADDDCKYDASFTNSCIVVGKPVTLMLTLRQRATGNYGNGAQPNSPEIFLADNPSHISPSNSIKATEGPLGTYTIGPIVFDVPGRWVVRFHYFERCSDVPPDSPHGHVAFYVDVP